MFLRNAGRYLQIHTALQLIRPPRVEAAEKFSDRTVTN
jgi:hypothetical protein